MRSEQALRPTATIIAFPLNERMKAVASSAHRFAAMEAAARRMAAVDDVAWYHGEAIAEDGDRPRN